MYYLSSSGLTSQGAREPAPRTSKPAIKPGSQAARQPGNQLRELISKPLISNCSSGPRATFQRLSLFRFRIAAMLGESAPGEETSDASSALAAENARERNKLRKEEKKTEKNKWKRKLEQTDDETTDQENQVAVAASARDAASVSGLVAVASAAAAFPNFTEDQAYLVVRMVRLVHQLTEGVWSGWVTANVAFDTFLAPSQDVLISAMADQGRRFAEAVEYPGYREGSPHLDVFEALLEAIANMDLDPLDKKRLEDYKKMTVGQRTTILHFCVLAKTYDENYMPPTGMRKIVLAFGNGRAAQSHRCRLQQVLVNRPNWTYKVGKPPPTYQNSEMSRFLAQMAS